MEETSYPKIMVFGLGILIQGLNLLGLSARFKEKILNLAICLFVASFSFLPSSRESVYSPKVHLISFLLMFSLIFSVVFMKEVLTKISEKIILIFTIIFWYAWYSRIGWIGILESTSLKLALIPTALVLFAALTYFRIHFILKLLLYIWFLIIITSMSLFVFGDILRTLFFRQQFPSFSYFQTFILGGSSLYLISNLMYLYLLIPIPGKHQSFSSRIKEWKKYIELLVEKFDKKQIAIRQSVIWTIVLFGLFSLNSIYHLTDPATMVTAVIFLLSLSESLNMEPILSAKKRTK